MIIVDVEKEERTFDDEDNGEKTSLVERYLFLKMKSKKKQELKEG